MLYKMRPLGAFGLGATNTQATQQQIVSIAQQYGVDPNLALAVAKQESGYNQNARSSAGAIGVMQLMPATAAGLGVDPTDQTGNITGGVKYLAQLESQFGGDTTKVLAAYNAGPGAVLKYNGVPPYAETQDYVTKVTANYNALGGSSSVTPDSTTTASDTTYADVFNTDNTDTTDTPALAGQDMTAWYIGGAVLFTFLFLYNRS